jgi:hypothetical protein
MEERLTRLESAHAKLYAKHTMLMLAFTALLAGELSPELLARLKERQIANALSTNAPDASIDGFEETFGFLNAALANAQNPA